MVAEAADWTARLAGPRRRVTAAGPQARTGWESLLRPQQPQQLPQQVPTLAMVAAQLVHRAAWLLQLSLCTSGAC